MVGDGPRWLPDWTGATVVVVASGPSAKDVPLWKGRGRAKFIAVNNSWLLCKWADMLYACDERWWSQYPEWSEFRGIKVSQDQHAISKYGPRGVKRVHCNKNYDVMLMEKPGYIGWAGNSGFQALNIAAHTKPSKIILVGFDMHIKAGIHWHGIHQGTCMDPKENNIIRWRRCTDAAFGVLAAAEIKAFNCSPDSALTAYPKMTFEAALDA